MKNLTKLLLLLLAFNVQASGLGKIEIGPGDDNYVTAGNPLPVTDYFHEVTEGVVTGHSMVHKFGRNEDVGTTYEPLAIGGLYNTPQISGATALRIKAGGHANDTAAGSGAQEISIECLSITGEITTTVIATNGASASLPTDDAMIRLVRAYVSKSGTYATSVAGSHAASITLENAAGGTDWLTIDATDFPRGQSQVAVYTVPFGYTAHVYNYTLSTDSNKAIDFLFFQRQGILDTTSPYKGMRTVVEEVGIQGQFFGEFKGGQTFPELTDIGFMVKAATTAVATADFEIVLVANDY